MTNLYNLRTTTSGWQVTKFDDDFNVESSYEMTQDDELRCGCPAGARPTCRHRQMFGALQGIANTDAFYSYDDKTYRNMDGSLYGTTGEFRVPIGNGVAISTGEAALSKPEPEPHPRAEAQSAQGWIDSGTIKFVEEQAEPEKPISLPDSHPFRRRM